MNPSLTTLPPFSLRLIAPRSPTIRIQRERYISTERCSRIILPICSASTPSSSEFLKAEELGVDAEHIGKIIREHLSVEIYLSRCIRIVGLRGAISLREKGGKVVRLGFIMKDQTKNVVRRDPIVVDLF